MYEWYPILVILAVIAIFTTAFILAYAFMKANTINGNVTAWDGGTLFNYETEILEAGGPRSNQHTWKKYVKKKWLFWPARERIGKRVLSDVY